jgi:hypothetical protein
VVGIGTTLARATFDEGEVPDDMLASFVGGIDV